jgi:PAS domain S-box-containing protein
VGIAHIGPDGKWSKVNQKFCEIVGYREDELINHSYIEIAHPDDLPQSLEQVRRVIEDNTVSIAYEKRYIRKDGEYIWVNVTRSAVRSQSGDTLYYLSIIEISASVSRRKQLCVN